jgi:hypothetical protein
MLDLEEFAAEHDLTTEDILDMVLDFADEMNLTEDLEEYLRDHVHGYAGYEDEEEDQDEDEEEEREDD